MYHFVSLSLTTDHISNVSLCFPQSNYIGQIAAFVDQLGINLLTCTFSCALFGRHTVNDMAVLLNKRLSRLHKLNT